MELEYRELVYTTEGMYWLPTLGVLTVLFFSGTPLRLLGWDDTLEACTIRLLGGCRGGGIASRLETLHTRIGA